ncbi:hypothetical protein HHK36_003889 [Tetracentron sinense]|uniref:tRNA/rRNA methyltransferase SpoU type domain-containing protein n=1 Tax=Tetracentron sinense TaxID=13715 RepID=A0A834ZRX0_TETSI|nr:hypothetical protein HHK36_003889 [Tetracentron sinense]
MQMQNANTQTKPSILHCRPSQARRSSGDDFSLPLPSHVKSITSPSNPFVKHCLKLRHSSSYRHSHASALVLGTTPIREISRYQELIRERPTTMECLLLLDGAEVPKGLGDSSNRIVRVSSMVMKKLAGVQSIDSIEAIALMRIPTSFCNVDDNHKEANCQSWFPSPHRILVLDGIQGIFEPFILPTIHESSSLQDPGNLGTLLRSAMAFRWGGAFLLPGCCDPFNEKALRAARGASFQLPIVSGNWVHLEALRNKFQMKMLAGHPESTEEPKLSSSLSQKFADSLADKALCLVLGSEGHGLSEQSRRACELDLLKERSKTRFQTGLVAGCAARNQVETELDLVDLSFFPGLKLATKYMGVRTSDSALS